VSDPAILATVCVPSDPAGPIRVLVVAEPPDDGADLGEQLGREPDLEVTSTAAITGEAVAAAASDVAPDVVVVELSAETEGVLGERVAAAVRGVAAGHAVVSPALLRDAVEPAPADPACTPREREVLALVALGATNPEICDRLTVSEATVRTHVRNLRRKLAARTRAELVSRAFRLGLARPGAG
jgi:DNA-binding CsgD family transcriptional regulator